MPTISMFYGIIIRMYCAPREHSPSHFHAYYGDYKAIIDINNCELIANWRLAMDSELPFKIEPLK